MKQVSISDYAKSIGKQRDIIYKWAKEKEKGGRNRFPNGVSVKTIAGKLVVHVSEAKKKRVKQK